MQAGDTLVLGLKDRSVTYVALFSSLAAFLAALGGGQPNALLFAGDLGQRIFQALLMGGIRGVRAPCVSITAPPLSWLSPSYETTAGIRKLAERRHFRHSAFSQRQAVRDGLCFQTPGNHTVETRLPGWGGRTRTSEWRNQNPLPYHLATPQRGSHDRRAPYSGGSRHDQRHPPCTPSTLCAPAFISASLRSVFPPVDRKRGRTRLGRRSIWRTRRGGRADRCADAG